MLKKKKSLFKKMDVLSASSHGHLIEGTNVNRGGAHNHVFFIDNIGLIYTDRDGAHSHFLLSDGMKTSEESGHKHYIQIDQNLFETSDSTSHDHELESTYFKETSFGGNHVHKLIYGEKTYQSLTPLEIWQLRIDGKLSFKPVITFVVGSPSKNEEEYGDLLIEDDEKVFIEKYLSPLGLTKKDVRIVASKTSLKDSDNEARIRVNKLISPSSVTVALGLTAKNALGDKADFYLPHPNVVRIKGDNGILSKKIPELKSAISAEHMKYKIIKSEDEKQITYGVVICPHQIDSHNHYMSPKEVENAAHEYIIKSRVIGDQHTKLSTSQVVESYLFPYPNKDEYLKALENKPHKCFRQKQNEEEIHSGDWILAVKHDKDTWNKIQEGERQAYSPGILAYKSDLSESDMCKEIEYIDI